MNNEIVHSETDEQRLTHEREFLSRIDEFKPLDAIEHSTGVKKGDLVVVRNGYDLLVGPFKVLGFETGNDGPRMYLDWDCYWFSTRVDKIFEIQKSHE